MRFRLWRRTFPLVVLTTSLVWLAAGNDSAKRELPTLFDCGLGRFAIAPTCLGCSASLPGRFKISIGTISQQSTWFEIAGFGDDISLYLRNIVKLWRSRREELGLAPEFALIAALAAALVVAYCLLRRLREQKDAGQILKRIGKFGLKALFVMIGLVAASLWAGDYFFVRPDRQHRQALITLKKLGGVIEGGETQSGSDAHGTVTVQLQGPQITDEALRHAARVKRLKNLYLRHVSITDTGLQHVQAMTDLTGLWLVDVRITDKGVRAFRGHPKLGHLTIQDTQITDDALTHLSALPSLQRLELSRSQVTDRGMAELSRCQNLRWLELNWCAITDEGLFHLSELRQLQQLTISKTQVTKAGVGRLSESLPDCTFSGAPKPHK